MAIGIQLGSIVDEIGNGDFFHAFFSTISGNLEPDGWGSRFPILIRKLYNGELQQEDANAALSELAQIKSELAKFSATKIIWDIEHREKNPPWGSKIASDITNLSNYFVTSTGRDLIDVLKEVLEELRNKGGVVKIVTI